MGSSPNIDENGIDDTFHSEDVVTYSEDSGDIDNFYEGYHRIPADQRDEIEAENHNSTELLEDTHQSQLNQQIVGPSSSCDAGNAELDFESKVWKNPRPKELEMELDISKTEQIMAAMAHITLPLSAIPEWAHEISENQWKEDLLNRIRQQKECISLNFEHEN
ncbi:uncharacterized protein LOC129616377 [Condylostylus longicornis]|uniref:uncharacterized protein LOC129616377 n=1 Tax=Condylostylus longicornis TaxID=2530218 RepID=UPI00244DCCE6|nr:uncharacterized protein LOC129616377 [Condylostylus longicornis]